MRNVLCGKLSLHDECFFLIWFNVMLLVLPDLETGHRKFKILGLVL
jgi:hypothetical protein